MNFEKIKHSRDLWGMKSEEVIFALIQEVKQLKTEINKLKSKK